MSGEGNTFVFRYADLVRPGSSRGSRSASARTRILLGTEGAGNSQGTPVAAFAIPPTYHRRVGAIPAREVPIASPTPSQPLHQAEGDAWPFQPRLPDPLPSRWEVPAGSVVGNAGAREGERVAQVGHLQIGPGLRIKYVGPGALDSDAAHILADKPVPRDQPVFCFEVEIINRGDDGYIGIGLARRGLPVQSLPGWKAGSYGYHGDDGKIFGGSGEGTDFGPTFTTGDVVSCIWCQVTRTISFAKNGVHLGVAFRDVQEECLYPTVGLRTRNEEVLANFGGGPEPLRGNLKEGMIAELTESTAAAINATALPLSPWAPHATFSLHKVVHDYLQHSGYPGAARAMEAAQLSDGVGGGEAAAGGDHKAQADAVAAHDVEARAEIQAAVLAGDIDRAETVVNQLAPGLLEQEEDIRFRMNCQRFMEMCGNGNDLAAISFGLQHLSESSASHPAGPEMIADAAVMLAFPDTPGLRCSDLRLSYRRKLASAINSSLQVRAGRPAHSSLERMLSQLALVHKNLEAAGDTLMNLLPLENQGLTVVDDPK